MEILWAVGIVLAAIGALNWGLVALFQFDLVAAVTTGDGHFGRANPATRLVYALVGIAGIIAVVSIFDLISF